MAEHARCSNTDDAKVYHAIKFGQDHPNYKPKGDEVPKDRPVDNDQRFSYYTTVKRWDTCQVAEERTIRVATDRVNSWLINPEMTATFPPSQLEANQAAKRPSGKVQERDNLQYLLIQIQLEQSNLNRTLMQQRLQNRVKRLVQVRDDIVLYPSKNRILLASNL